MKIVTTRTETRSGLSAIRRRLSDAMGKPIVHLWSFPGGGRDDLPTWFNTNVAGKPLAVAIGSDNAWGTRTPFLVARTPLAQSMTPTVEINIPAGPINRAVAGCICRSDGEADLVLAHRGTSLTASPGKVPKHAVHEHFAKWLVNVEDGERRTDVIPAAPAGTDVARHLAQFADEILTLKTSWTSAAGREEGLPARSSWREELQFPPTIRRALTASTKNFEYRHGPLQASLRAAIDACISRALTTALNFMIDLAILRQDKVLSIFEVKTDIGPQLYSAIGQLLWYRELFASRTTPLFLVLPEGVRDEAEIADVGTGLAPLGIGLLLGGDEGFRRWDGASLSVSLVAVGVPVRRIGRLTPR